MIFNWISIADKMPKNGDEVLIWNDHLFAGRWEHGHWLSNEESSTIEGVTHWMPAPKAPTKSRTHISILRQVIGEWKVDDLVGHDFDMIWSVLKDQKPFYETRSLHVLEERYEYQNKIYQVCWDINDLGKIPDSIGIRTRYDWSKK